RRSSDLSKWSGASQKQPASFPLCHTASTKSALMSALFHTPRLSVVNTPMVDGAKKWQSIAKHLNKLRRLYLVSGVAALSLLHLLSRRRQRLLETSAARTTSRYTLRRTQ